MSTLHPSHVHILCRSLERSVKQTWTAPPFPSMRVLEVRWSWALSLVCEMARNVRVTDSHPKAVPNFYVIYRTLCHEHQPTSSRWA